MKRLITCMLVGAFVLMVNCSHQIKLDPATTKVTAKGILSVSANWIKDKQDKFDMRLRLNNESESGLIILLNDIRCFRGSARGQIKHTFFNTGERTIDFQAGEVKVFNIVCRFDSDTTGDFKIAIHKVYENKELDGKTKGKVLATNIEWVLKATK